MTFRDHAFFYPQTRTLKPRIAISACLAGEIVRYDGARKPLSDSGFFEQHFQLLTVCPEVGAGLSVPRPPVQLVQTDQRVRALGRDDPSLDLSDKLATYSESSVNKLREAAICGYIFKSQSPSCGLGSTPVFDTQGVQIELDSGIQARHVQQHMPWLVLREETAINTLDLRRNFLWLCKISSECQRAIERDQLPSFHRHYQTLLPPTLSATTCGKEYRQQLIEALNSSRWTN